MMHFINKILFTSLFITIIFNHASSVNFQDLDPMAAMAVEEALKNVPEIIAEHKNTLKNVGEKEKNKNLDGCIEKTEKNEYKSEDVQHLDRLKDKVADEGTQEYVDEAKKVIQENAYSTNVQIVNNLLYMLIDLIPKDLCREEAFIIVATNWESEDSLTRRRTLLVLSALINNTYPGAKITTEEWLVPAEDEIIKNYKLMQKQEDYSFKLLTNCIRLSRILVTNKSPRCLEIAKKFINPTNVCHSDSCIRANTISLIKELCRKNEINLVTPVLIYALAGINDPNQNCRDHAAALGRFFMNKKISIELEPATAVYNLLKNLENFSAYIDYC